MFAIGDVVQQLSTVPPGVERIVGTLRVTSTRGMWLKDATTGAPRLEQILRCTPRLDRPDATFGWYFDVYASQVELVTPAAQVVG